MSRSVLIGNRQDTFPIHSRLLRRIVLAICTDLLQLPAFDLAVEILEDAAMAHLNETFLGHLGATDVLTFDYSDPAVPSIVCGEIFVCPHEAARQARRFHTTWPTELVRYVIHGTLHLLGYQDHHRRVRLKMKRYEDKLLREVASRFPLRELRRPQLLTRRKPKTKRSRTLQGIGRATFSQQTRQPWRPE